MDFMMKTKLMILIAAIALIAMPALAELKAYPNSGGMNLPTFIDSKAEPMIGVGTSPDGKSKAELGGIYTLGGQEPGPGPFEGEGPVILDIFKNGANIVVKWKINDVFLQYATSKISVYCKAGDGAGSYDIVPGNWIQLVNEDSKVLINNNLPVTGFGYDISILDPTVPDNPEKWKGVLTAPSQVGLTAGKDEIYFKALIPAVENLQASFGKVATVGKIDKTFPKNGAMELVSVPLYENKISGIFPPQLKLNQELILLPQSGGGLNYVVAKNSGIVGNDFEVKPAIGFWVRNANADDIVITFAGRVVNMDLTQDLVAFDLTGNPLPKDIGSDVSGNDGDIILPQSGGGLSYFVRSNGSWGPNFTQLKFNKGFWFKYSGDKRRWDVDPSVPSATIEKY